MRRHGKRDLNEVTLAGLAAQLAQAWPQPMFRLATALDRWRARESVPGLLSDLPRKNCWTPAEHAGKATPYGLRHLLSRAKWDADAVRDDPRSLATEQLHFEETVLVVDETGHLKRGTAAAGVQRQYTALPGASKTARPPSTRLFQPTLARGDRSGLQVPRSWITDAARCRLAGFPRNPVSPRSSRLHSVVGVHLNVGLARCSWPEIISAIWSSVHRAGGM